MKTVILLGISLFILACNGGPDPYAGLACHRKCRAEGKVNDSSRTTKDKCYCKEIR